MNSKSKQSIFILKNWLVKRVAIIIVVCYLISPIQNQVYQIFHDLSHFIEMPSTLLSHSYDTQYEVHKAKAHHRVVNNHSHELITFVSKLLENNDADSEKSISQNTFDKHFTNRFIIVLPNPILINNKGSYSTKKTDPLNGYLTKHLKPPQFIFC